MSFPNLAFWSNLLGTVAVEVCVVVALGIAAQYAFRRAYWQRAMWQMSIICLPLILTSEWTGAGRGAVWSLLGPKRAIITGATITLSPNVEFRTLKGAYAISPPMPAQKKPLWWPGWVWLAGAVIVLGRMATAQGLLLVLRFRREKIVDDTLQERVNRVAKILGLRRKISLLRLPESISPMAFGIFFPTIGLPPGFETGFSAGEQDAILAHELAHLAVLDPLWFRLADFASALLWWHPLAWWARRSLHGASELAADEATALVADGPSSLANCLVGLGKKMTLGHGWGWVGINGEFRSKLGKRVERLTRMPGKAGRPFVSWTDTVTRIAVAILIAPAAVLLLFAAFQTAHGERENGWRESWNSSPGRLLAMAALDTADNPTKGAQDIVGRITNGILLYDMGKLTEAKAILMRVIIDDPSNAKAAYYLNLIKEAQFMDRHRKKGPTEIPLTTNDDPLIPARADQMEGVTTNKQADKASIAARVQNAKLLYETGRLEESKTILKQVMQDDPSNKTAPYFLKLIKEAEFLDRARKREAVAKSAILNVEQDNLMTPNPVVPNGLVFTTRGRQAILSKLDNIRLNEVQYDLPLTEVLNRLRIESKMRDPNGVSINFLINPRSSAPMGASSPGDTSGTTPVGAVPITAPVPSADMGSVNIKISPALSDVSLLDVLNAITINADQPIKYTVEDYAVVFSPKPPKAITLYSKTYHLDPNTFTQRIMALGGIDPGNSAVNNEKAAEGKPVDDGIVRTDDGHDSLGGPASSSSQVGLNFVKQTNNTVQLDTMVRSYFTATGVDLTAPGKSVFFNNRLGLLLVRVTAEDLQLIDTAIGALNQSPPQVVPKPAKSDTLYSKAFQLYTTGFKKNLLAAMGSVPGSNIERTNDTAQFNQLLLAYFARAGAKLTSPDETIVSDDRASVLIVRATPEKLQIIEQALEPLNKVPPQITISSKFVDLSQQDAKALGFERFLQASETNLTSVMSPPQFEAVFKSILQNTPSDILAAPKVTTLSGRQAHIATQDLQKITIGNTTTTVALGPALDIIADVLEDGYSIKTVLVPTYTEFLQYDPVGKFVPSAEASSGNKTSAPTAAQLPLPHYRTYQMALSCNIRDGQTVVTGHLISEKPSEPKKLRLFFATLRIIDAAGNSIHSDEELSTKP